MDSKVRDGITFIGVGLGVSIAAAGVGGHSTVTNLSNLTDGYALAFWVGVLIASFGALLFLWGLFDRLTGRSNSGEARLARRLLRLMDDIGTYLVGIQVPGAPLPPDWYKRQERFLSRATDLIRRWPNRSFELNRIRDDQLGWIGPLQTREDWAAKERAEEIWRMQRLHKMLRELMDDLSHSTRPAISSQDQM
jgi:hypothetical protein